VNAEGQSLFRKKEKLVAGFSSVISIKERLNEESDVCV